MLRGADPNEARLQGCEAAEDLFKRGEKNGKSITMRKRTIRRLVHDIHRVEE
jgi:hypothetical protein